MPGLKMPARLAFLAAATLIGAFAVHAARDAPVPPAQTAADVQAVTCSTHFAGAALPAEVRETSGLAASMRRPGVFWTHNDRGGRAELYAFDSTGALLQRVPIDGARLVDWEDIDAAPCASGKCLYIGDIGDNSAQRETITIYEVGEPPAAAPARTARALHARYPEGPQDAEGLFVHDGRPHVVTKGRTGPVRLYRYPDSAQPGTIALLELVAVIGPQPAAARDLITGAAATPDGRWIALRSNHGLFLFEAAALLRGDTAGRYEVDLRPLRESQGEGLAIDDAGNVHLTSEAEDGGSPTWAALRCTLPRDTAASDPGSIR